MILAAQHVRERALKGMIEPFCERGVSHGMSYGLSSAGLDIRIRERRVMRPGDFTLASTIERFNLPTDILAMIVDKSSLARRGIAVQHTCAEPGWCGYLTLEITNHGPNTIVIEEGSPIAQMIFHLLSAPTEQPYGNGKYADQPAHPVEARIEQ